MALSTETLQTIRSIGITSARREDGLAIYPPFGYAILRRATVAMARALAMEGMVPELFQALQQYENIGHFVHPRTPNFLLVMVDIYEAAHTQHLQRRSAEPESDDHQEDQNDDGQNQESRDQASHVDLAQKLGEHFSVSPRQFLNAAD